MKAHIGTSLSVNLSPSALVFLFLLQRILSEPIAVLTSSTAETALLLAHFARECELG
jgi:hypothetical protein